MSSVVIKVVERKQNVNLELFSFKNNNMIFFKIYPQLFKLNVSLNKTTLYLHLFVRNLKKIQKLCYNMQVYFSLLFWISENWASTIDNKFKPFVTMSVLLNWNSHFYEVIQYYKMIFVRCMYIISTSCLNSMGNIVVKI